MASGQGESTLADYMRKILNEKAHVWVTLDGSGVITSAGLTEILQYAQHKTVHIILYSGYEFEMDGLERFSEVVKFAKTSGCKSIEQWGREGWVKMLPKVIPGFKKVYTVMRYDLTEETTNEIQKG